MNNRTAINSIQHRTVALLLAAAVLFCVLTPVRAEEPEKPDIGAWPETYILLAEADDPYTALGGLEKAADAKAYPASIVKLLTAIVALERNKLTDTVTVSEHAVDLSGANTKAGLRVGEIYTLEDLLYASLLPSACDAARAVADLVAGGEEPFAVLMNEKAAELGMSHSHFTNASGLHDEEQYTNCRDLILLGKACAENETLCGILTTKDHVLHEKTSGRKISVKNINRLVRDPNPADYEKIQCLYPYCVGGKTGSTNAAGLTFMAMACRDGKTLVCVLLGNYTETKGLKGTPYDIVIASRFQEAVDLFRYGFSLLFPTVTDEALLKAGLPGTFTFTDPETGLPVAAKAVPAGKSVSVSTEMLADLSGVQAAAEPAFTLPVEAGDTVGEAIYSYNGSVFLRLPLVAEAPVPPATPEPSEAPALTALPAVTPTPSARPAAQTGSSPAVKILFGVLTVLIVLVAVFLLLLLSSGRKKRRHKRK